MAMPAILRTGRQSGFTLIELTLAVSLSGIVLAAVYSTFTVGVDTQRRVARAAGETQAWRFFAERVRADLRNLTGDSRLEQPDDDALTLRGRDGGAVRYARDDNRQIRRVELDRHGDIRADVTVFEGAIALAFRFLAEDRWQDEIDVPLPRAIEFVIDTGRSQQRLVVAVEVDDASASDPR